MKKNALSLAMLAYPVLGSQDAFVTTDAAQQLLENITDGGVRSILHYLSKSGIFSTEKIGQELRYYLTDKGIEQLNAQFPALDSKWDSYSGEWECIVFQEAPSSDPQFRYLRSQLVAEHAIQLSRGVYCVPGSLSQELYLLCKKMYPHSIALFSIDAWKFGFERSTVIRNFSLSDLATAYSSISTEVSQLLAQFAEGDGLTDQQKKVFISAYDRFRDTVQEDNGLVAYYYPNAISARKVLAQFQSAFSGFLVK